MKIKKRRKNKKKQVRNNVLNLVLLLAMLVFMIIAMTSYWIFAYHHKYGTNPIKDKIISFKVDDYVLTKGDTVILKGLDSKISKNFLDKQQKILTSNRVVGVSINKDISRNILSIFIKYTFDNGYTNYLTFNYDLKKNILLDNDFLLNKINVSYKDIANNLFDKYIKLDNIDSVIDNIDNKKLSKEEFNNNKYKYVIRLREELPSIMNIYIEDNNVYYTLKYKDIEKLCYKSIKKNFMIKEKLGKI